MPERFGWAKMGKWYRQGIVREKSVFTAIRQSSIIAYMLTREPLSNIKALHGVFSAQICK